MIQFILAMLASISADTDLPMEYGLIETITKGGIDNEM